MALSWASAFKPADRAVDTGFERGADVSMEAKETSTGAAALEGKAEPEFKSTNANPSVQLNENEPVDIESAERRSTWRTNTWDDDDDTIVLGKPTHWGASEDFAGFRKPRPPTEDDPM